MVQGCIAIDTDEANRGTLPVIVRKDMNPQIPWDKSAVGSVVVKPAVDEKWPALHTAIEIGRNAVPTLLLNHGASPHILDTRARLHT